MNAFDRYEKLVIDYTKDYIENLDGIIIDGVFKKCPIDLAARTLVAASIQSFCVDGLPQEIAKVLPLQPKATRE